MLRHRVIAALLGGLFSFQLALGGGNAACPMMAAAAGEAESPSSEMAGMAMAPMNGERAYAGDAAGKPDSEAPCEHSTSPKRCQLMAPCTAGFIVPVISLTPAPSLASTSALASIVSMPLSVTSPPELPPPRA